MDKQKLFSIFLFSALVTAMMNSLDMIFHLFEGTAVHLNYVAIKITIIFLTVFLTALVVGLGRSEGLFTSILGPVIFFIYYRVASSTLNRELFRLDEQLWYVFPHVLALGFSYWMAYDVLARKSNWKKTRAIAQGLSLALMAIALDFIYLMFRVSLASGRNEEIIAKTLNPAYAGVLLAAFTIIFSLLFQYRKNLQKGKNMQRYSWLAMPLIAGIIVYVYGMDQSLSHGVAMLAIVLISYFIQKQVINRAF